MSVEYTGAGNVRKLYGPRLSTLTNPDPAPASEKTFGNTVELFVRFNFDNVPSPSAASANDAVESLIPANAFVESVRLYVEVPFVGGTSIAIDQRAVADGSVATANAYVTATQGATANLTQSAWIVGTGSLIGASSGSADTKLGVTVVGTYTAGRGGFIVRYIKPTTGGVAHTIDE